MDGSHDLAFSMGAVLGAVPPRSCGNCAHARTGSGISDVWPLDRGHQSTQTVVRHTQRGRVCHAALCQSITHQHADGLQVDDAPLLIDPTRTHIHNQNNTQHILLRSLRHSRSRDCSVQDTCAADAWRGAGAPLQAPQVFRADGQDLVLLLVGEAHQLRRLHPPPRDVVPPAAPARTPSASNCRGLSLNQIHPDL